MRNGHYYFDISYILACNSISLIPLNSFFFGGGRGILYPVMHLRLDTSVFQCITALKELFHRTVFPGGFTRNHKGTPTPPYCHHHCPPPSPMVTTTSWRPSLDSQVDTTWSICIEGPASNMEAHLTDCYLVEGNHGRGAGGGCMFGRVVIQFRGTRSSLYKALSPPSSHNRPRHSRLCVVGTTQGLDLWRCVPSRVGTQILSDHADRTYSTAACILSYHCISMM